MIESRISEEFDSMLSMLDYLFTLNESTKQKSEVRSVTLNKAKKVTTVVLNDGKVGIAKCAEEDEYDEKVGFALAYCYAKFGSKNKFNKELASHIPTKKENKNVESK